MDFRKDLRDNDIEKLEPLAINIDEIGKYGKLKDVNNFLFLSFTSDKLKCEKLTKKDLWESSLRMCDNLEKKLIASVQPKIDVLYEKFCKKKRKLIKKTMDKSKEYARLHAAVCKSAKLMIEEENIMQDS